MGLLGCRRRQRLRSWRTLVGAGGHDGRRIWRRAASAGGGFFVAARAGGPGLQRLLVVRLVVKGFGRWLGWDQIWGVMSLGGPAGGFFRPWEGGAEGVRGWSGGSRGTERFLGGSNLFCRCLIGARPAASMEAAVEVVAEIGWWPQFFPDLFVLLLNFYLYLVVYFAYVMSGIRVFFTLCILVLVLCSSRIINVYLVMRALGSPSMVFITPIWPEFCFGAQFLREFMPIGKIRVIFTLCVLVLCRIRSIISSMVFVTPMWPEFSFGTPFLRESIFIFPIWYSDTLQEIMLCKRIVTVAGGFGPQSLVGDPVLVVYSLGIFCNFNGFVCLFHGTSLFRDLYAVMDIVQFKD